MSEAMVRASGGFSRENMAAARAEGKNEGITETKVGTAENYDVLSGKTYTNHSAVGAVGSMPNNGSYNIELATRNSEAFIPQGYHTGGGRVSVQQPVYTKYLTASQTGNVDLSPYDYKYVNAEAVYKAGKDEAASMTHFFVTNLGVATIGKDEYTESMTVANNTRYPMGLIVNATASVTSTADSYAVPVIDVANGTLLDSYTTENTSTNVKNKLVVAEYTVSPNTTATVRIKGTVHGCNMAYSVSAGRISL